MKPDRCPSCKRRLTRSSQANRRYWALLHRMAEVIRPAGQAFAADSWHLWCKSKWLGCDDVRLPTGAVLSIPRSTADLDVEQFDRYLTAVEEFANSRGAYLEDEVLA